MAISVPAASGISVLNSDGTTSPFDLNVIYVEARQVLIADTILSQVALASRISGGTAYYYVGQRNVSRNYTGAQPPEKVFSRTVEIQINKAKDLSFTYETNDWVRLGATLQNNGKNITVAKALITNIIGGNALSVQTYLACEIIQARANMVNNKAEQNFTLPILKDGIIDVPTGTPLNDFLQQKILLPINTLIAKLESLVNSEYIGLNRTDFQMRVSPRLYAYLSHALALVGSDLGVKILQNYDFVKIGNLMVVKDNLLGTNHTVGTIDKDEAYDFSGIDIQIFHKEALAFPYSPTREYLTLDPSNGNPNFINKWLVPGKIGSPAVNQTLALRPKLALQGSLVNAPTTNIKK